jgi:hypothetical protein
MAGWIGRFEAGISALCFLSSNIRFPEGAGRASE